MAARICHGLSCGTRRSGRRPTIATTSIPAASGHLKPMPRPMRPASRPGEEEQRTSPEAGRPRPWSRSHRSRSRRSRAVAAAGRAASRRSSGSRTNVPNIAKPAISAVMFVNRIGRCASMRMSTSGSRRAARAKPHTTSSTAAGAEQPRMRADDQPQRSPSVSATSSAIRPPRQERSRRGSRRATVS